MEVVKEFFSVLSDLFFPEVCPFCDRIVYEGKAPVCAHCLSKIEFVSSPVCTCCGKPFIVVEVEDHFCGECIREKRFYTKARAILFYEGAVMEAIHRFKYSSATNYARAFGWLMYEHGRQFIDLKDYDCIIPVPLHKKKLMNREFNQAQLLSQEISKYAGIPLELFAVQRVKETLSQVGLKKEERQKNVRIAFRVLKDKKVKGRTILLIDDVLSTTATVNECARALRKSGAKRVDVLALARGR